MALLLSAAFSTALVHGVSFRTLGPCVASGSSHLTTTMIMEDGDDMLGAFAARRNEEVKGEKQKNRKPGEGPATQDREGLPIRLGGDVRDASLGDLRAAWNSFPLDVRDWRQEEYGLVGVLLLTVITIAWGYNFAFGEPVTEQVPIPTSDRERELYACLADAFGGSEKLICNVKYSPFFGS